MFFKSNINNKIIFKYNFNCIILAYIIYSYAFSE